MRDAGLRFCVMGTGSIGGYVGGRLLTAGADITFVGRESMRARMADGIRVTDYRGFDAALSPDRIRFSCDPAAASEANIVLVTVKSSATADVARQMKPYLRPDAVVVSLQNGIHNASILAAELPDHTVIQGMVPFNVVQEGHRFHQGTEGTLEMACSPAIAVMASLFSAAGLPLVAREAMPSVMWGKLLLNLNNAINALADVPLKEELSQRSYRRCIALAQREALRVMGVAGVRPARLTPIPPRWMPHMLSVPDAIFRRLANRMLEIDPLARSSMWEDLQRGRLTEVDWINGEIVKLAERHGLRAPVNEFLTLKIHEAEQGMRRPWAGGVLLESLARVAID